MRRAWVLLLSASLLLAAPLGALPRPKGRWIELRSPHFTVISSASEETARGVAFRLEQMRAVFGQVTHLNLESQVPIWVFVFATDRQLTSFKPLFDGRPLAGGGFFVRREGGSYIAVNGDFVAHPVSTVYHEYVHFVLRNNLSEVPLWLNEGLAEYFSSFKIRGAEAEVGREILAHLQWLRDNPLIPLSDLFAVDTDSPEYQENTRRGAFYAESWALVHYFLVGRKERSGDFVRFLDLLGDGEGLEEALEESLGTDLKRLQTEIARYVRRPTLGWVTIPIDEVTVPSFEMRPLPSHEVFGRLGDLLAHVGDHEAEAAEHFRAALAERPRDPLALSGLGFLAEGAERFDEALGYYEAATASPEADFLTCYLHARRLVEETASRASEARELLRRSVALNPSFAPAWSLLSFVYTLESPPPPEAVEVAETAHRLLPSSDEVLENLFAIYAGRGDVQAIEELMEHELAGRSVPDLYDRGRGFLLDARLREAQELAREGRTEEARTLLGELREESRTLDEQARVETELYRLREGFGAESFAARYNKALSWIGAGDFAAARALLQELAESAEGAEAQRVRELLTEAEAAAGAEQRNRFVEVYNRAVDSFNSGDRESGVRILEEVLATLPEGSPEAEQARELLARIKSQP